MSPTTVPPPAASYAPGSAAPPADADLAPEAAALLAQLRAYAAHAPAGGAPNDTPPDPWAAARAGYRGVIPLAGPEEPVAEVVDRQIPGPAGAIPVRIYRPAAGVLPVLVYFHGGGFTAGDLETHDRPLRAVANRAGCLVVSVAYRLAPEHPYPAAPDDCLAAAAWVAEHAAALGADAGRLAVGGDSAGGLLAAVVARRARDARGGAGPWIAFQVLLYPDTDLTESTPSWEAFAESNAPIITLAGKRASIAAYVPPGVALTDGDVSPLHAADLAGLPPALVLTGGADPQRDEGEAYARRLAAAGVSVVLRRYPGMIHGFFQMAGALAAGRAAVDEVAAALRHALR